MPISDPFPDDQTPEHIVEGTVFDTPKAPDYHPPPFPIWAPAVLLVLTAMSWTGRALLPLFDTMPLLVIGLSPEPWLIALANDKVTPVLLISVASLRLLVADPVWYYLGRYCTERVLAERGKKKRKRLKKLRKILEALVEHKENKHLRSRTQRILIQLLAYTMVLIYSSGIVMCAAGILELRRRAVAALAIIGTVTQVYLLMALGSSLFT